METLLEVLKAYVQSVADATPENAISIIESSGLALRKTTTLSGSVKLTAPLAGRRAAYRWQYSTDGGKTWVDASETLQAKTTVTGLPVGTTVQFRYRSVIKGGASDWSAPLSMVVS